MVSRRVKVSKEVKPGRVLVVGSINTDLVARAPHLPRPGETISGQEFSQVAGGKGGNQAVAAARIGARVAMVGRVGEDAKGAQRVQGLGAERNDCAGGDGDAVPATRVAIVT